MSTNKHDPRTCENSKPCFDCEHPIIKQYLIIGSNNFWYSIADTLKEAIQTAKEIKNKNSYLVYADPETGHEPEKPEELFIYESTLLKTI